MQRRVHIRRAGKASVPICSSALVEHQILETGRGMMGTLCCSDRPPHQLDNNRCPNTLW